MSSKTFSRAKVSVRKPAISKNVDFSKARNLGERVKGKTRISKPIGTAICGVCGCYERTW